MDSMRLLPRRGRNVARWAMERHAPVAAFASCQFRLAIERLGGDLRTQPVTQPSQCTLDPIRRLGETDAQVALAGLAKSHAGRDRDTMIDHKLFRRSKAVGHALDTDERIKCAVGFDVTNSVDAPEHVARHC